MWDVEKPPEEWKRLIVIPIYKGKKKGDCKDCEN
jgi:hypothetical protein